MDRARLISRIDLDAGLVRILGIAVMVAVFIASVLAALATVGLIAPTDWWAGLVAVASLTSMVLLTLFFAPALLLGYAIDIALLWRRALQCRARLARQGDDRVVERVGWAGEEALNDG